MVDLFHTDCMAYMRTVPDKFFDLAIVDPPYGLPKNSLRGSGKLKNRTLNQMETKWDVRPPRRYFKELFRVSKHQIIFGGNYFQLPETRCPVCWDKKQPWKNFSAWEYAWTSFRFPAPMFRYPNNQRGKIHPTQKPVKLYAWLLKQFAHPGIKILDTHLGSGSSAIAAHDAGFDFVGCEINASYFNSMMQRFTAHTQQGELKL